MGEETREWKGLMATEPGKNRDAYGHVLGEGERVLMEFKSIRDVCALTDRKLIAINVQGSQGRRKKSWSFPTAK